MKKLLDINTAPQLTSYVHHSYISAIVDRTFIAGFFVNDLNTENWKNQDTDILCTYDKKEGMVRLFEEKGRKSTSFEMKRRCNAEDEIIVKLTDINPMDVMAYIRVGISVEKNKECKQVPGGWVSWNQNNITIENGSISYKDHAELYYKLARKQDELLVSVSRNMKKWDAIYEWTCELSTVETVDFYIQVYFDENQYEQWINMNYIQLFFNEKDPNTVYLDYYMFPRKGYDASYQYMCHFIDTEYIDYPMYKKVEKVNIHKYIEYSLLQNYYVNVCLDEYYISNRKAYNSHKYEHYNLIYGFDNKKRLFYILGYNANGKIETSTISYKVLKKSFTNAGIVRYRYNVNRIKYNFRLSYIREMLQEYINGENSSQRFAGMLENRTGVYGIKVFEQLSNTEDGKRLLVEDKRISFVLYEHCKLMQNRLLYMDKMGYIKTSGREEIFEKCELMVKTSEILKNLVIKNSVRPRYKENIFASLANLKAYELDFMKCLLENLNTSM